MIGPAFDSAAARELAKVPADPEVLAEALLDACDAFDELFGLLSEFVEDFAA